MTDAATLDNPKDNNDFYIRSQSLAIAVQAVGTLGNQGNPTKIVQIAREIYDFLSGVEIASGDNVIELKAIRGK